MVGAPSEAEGAAYRQEIEALKFVPARCGDEPVRSELHLDPARLLANAGEGSAAPF